ncbi:MAG: NADPH-dependent F420 reductase [Flavitalea sp.]
MAKKTIAIIGATETIGSAIAKNLAKGNYRILLFSQSSEKLESLAQEINYETPAADIDCLNCLVDASWEADIIISTLPCGGEKQIAERIREVTTQKIVIICSSPGNNNSSHCISWRISIAEELQKLLPHSKIVKTFNSTLAANFEKEIAEGNEIDFFISGNDSEAVDIAREIISNAGFHPILAGELATSRFFENTMLIRESS